MSDDADSTGDFDVISAVGQVSRTDVAALLRRGGPTAQHLAAMPAAKPEDWAEAELMSPRPPDMLQMLLDREQAAKKAS